MEIFHELHVWYHHKRYPKTGNILLQSIQSIVWHTYLFKSWLLSFYFYFAIFPICCIRWRTWTNDHCAEHSYNFRYQNILGNKAQILKISMKIVFAISFHYVLLSNTLKICFFLNVTPKVSHSLHFRNVFLT